MSTKHATRGVIFIHSVPPPVQKHVEWAVSKLLGYRINFEWTEQPAQASMNRGEASWTGESGTGAMLATAFRGWDTYATRSPKSPPQPVRAAGGRHTPGLGIFYAQTDLTGNVVVPENRIRAAMQNSAGDPAELQRLLNLALGQAWDDELEPFRYAGAGAPVRWLHRGGLRAGG